MGKNNRARRAAKAKARARSTSTDPSAPGRAPWNPFGHRSPHEPVGPAWDPDPRHASVEVREAFEKAVQAKATKHPLAGHFAEVAATAPPALAYRVLADITLTHVAALWRGGWQPAEIERQGRRGTSTAPAARFVRWALAADDAGHRAGTIDPRWIAQVEALRLPAVGDGTGAEWVHRWIDQDQLHHVVAVTAAVDALAHLRTLPPLEKLLPPPGAAAGATAGPAPSFISADSHADPVLERIRALLAKAESTSFEAEATAFTAKAQELMTRHAIDAALVQGMAGSSDEPVTIRIPVDAPYVDAKSLLLQTAAEAGRCRAVMYGGLGMSAVVGFPDDIAGVELLFTSLLVQAQTFLAADTKQAAAGSRARSQGYRSAFLQAYAQRIGERLDEINQAVIAQAQIDVGGSFLPVLRSRSEAVDEVLDEQFGTLRQSRARGGYDAAGWASGRSAADRAKLVSGDLPSGSG